MPDVSRISPREEERLMQAVASAIRLVNDGEHPDKALAKMAAKQEYGPDFINRMVELYNTSRTLAHYKHADAGDRASDFPIASAEAIIRAVYPEPEALPVEEIKAAADYMTIKRHAGIEPGFEKAASYMRDGSALMEKVLNKEADLKRAEAQAGTELEAASLERQRSMQALAVYFRRPGHEKLATVDAVAKYQYGKAGELIMDAVWLHLGGLARHEKRSSYPKTPKLADSRREPYSLLARAYDASQALAEKQAEFSSRKEARKAYSQALRERFQRKAAADKSAFLGGSGQFLSRTLSMGLGSMMAKATEEDKAEAIKKTVEDITDPTHKSKLQAIQAEAALQDMLINDPVISRYDPSDVIEAYNAISSMAPRSAMQPAVMRGYLRRLLEGSDVLEPFEIQQLATTEEKMKPTKIETKPGIAPENVLQTIVP